MGSEHPGELEHVVLLALASCEEAASGREVYEGIVDTTGREVSVAAVHITLKRLHEKGWASCRTTAPPPGRGGKPRRSYRLSPAGAEVLARERAKLDRLWEKATAHPLLGGGGR